MPPNSQDVDLICLLGDDSDAENTASAEGGGGAAAAAAKRPATSTSDADADGLGGVGGQKKRRKEGEEDPLDVKPVIAGIAAPAAAAAANKGSAQYDSDIEEVEANTAGWRSATGGGGTGNNGGGVDSNAVGGSGSGGKKKVADAAADDDDEEEFEIVATKGQNALADFPHSRANCVTHPFANGGDKKAHCDNCYCYVCDMPAADCKVWDSHCKANHEDRRWREERERFKRLGVEAAAAPIATAARSQPAAAARAQTNPFGRAIVTTKKKKSSTGPNPELSVRKLLQKLTAVHPVEISPPAGSGFTTDLRHYQKQSLAFLVDVEKSSATDNQKMRGGWLADEVGMGKTAVVLALVATNPAVESVLPSEQEIRSHVSELNSRESKRASAVLDCNTKRAEYIRPYEEAVAALAPTDPNQLPSEKYRAAKRVLGSHQDQKRFEYEELLDSLSRKHKMDRLKLKGTVILTSVSLMGQWEDEVEKHAPGLTIKTFHSSRRSNPLFVNLSAGHRSGKLRGEKDHTTDPDVCNADSMVELSKADVIISSSTIWWPKLVAKGFEFRRVVHDESHLFGGPSAKVEAANYISSQFRWCVTATPLASSFRDLGRQLEFIWGKERWGAGGAYQGDYDEIERATRTGNSSQEQFDRLVGILGRYLIRHTKSQRIGGEEILALPPSTTSTVMLTMSKDEDKALNKVHTTAKVLNRCLEWGGETFTIERCFGFPLGSILRSDTSDKDYRSLVEVGGKKKTSGKIIRRLKFQGLTKIIALRKDLQEQLEKEPNLRAVVFTQYLDVHAACVRGLEADNFEILQFTGSSDSRKRDAAIRSFQQTDDDTGPAVFVVTLRSGSVGITLTAASRVYLLEPCLDPAVEVQAAGRIHRLGQDKPCHVVKFAFKNSYEANILKLHEKLGKGKLQIVDGRVEKKAVEILAKGVRKA